MLKFILLFAFFFGMAVYVAVEDKRAAQQSTQKADAIGGAVGTTGNADHPQKNVEDSKGNEPSWFGFFRWPEGTTTWAIVLTLLAIAEQTRETRRSAEAAFLGANVAIAAQRPWIRIDIEELPGENPAKTNFQLYAINQGNSPARIMSCKGPIATWLDDPNKELPVPPEYTPPEDGNWNWDARFLGPKDSVPLRDAIQPWSSRLNYVTPRAMKGIPTPGKTQLVIYGVIEYRDGVTENVHTTAYCYRRNREKFSDMGGHLVTCGPPIYNDYT